MARIFITHGYDAHPQKHWFVWLKSQLEGANTQSKLLQESLKESVSVEILKLPNPSAPNLDLWLACLQEVIGVANERTFLVGHSLGCITTLRYINEFLLNTQSQNIGGVVLVSGFYENLETLPELNTFINPPNRASLQWESLQKAIKSRVVLCAKDDVVVPSVLSANLAKKLNAELIILEKGGHFMESDGFKELPIILEILLSQLSTSHENKAK
ncbi:RBBP9/YdeN family alpha/beta hydrolase [Helicobacter himalayensis]|uniref:RBBP9/YdeN family alpha/beta hydrolase n=1 Tax=Helicobacter himalayensis TaxID=1591088 RepID=UPI00082E22AB|nr:alpha/beta hydrolase [Helicobacter himalayensis]